MKEALVKYGKKIAFELAKHKGDMLIGISVGSFTGAFVMSFQAGMRLKELIDQQAFWDASTGEKVKMLVPIVGPSLATYLVGVLCLFAGLSEKERRNATLGLLLSTSQEDLKAFEEKAIEKFGERKVEDIHDEINKEKVANNPPTEGNIIFTGHGNYLFYDDLTGQWFRSTIETVRRVILDLNEEIDNGNDVSVSDWCDRHDIPEGKLSWEYGWSKLATGKIDVRFTSCISPDGEPAIVIEHKNEPSPKYDKYEGVY